jgi:hypothetical protein
MTNFRFWIVCFAAICTLPFTAEARGLQHKFAQVNGIRMHYVEQGSGPLVSGSEDWKPRGIRSRM